MKKFLPFLFVLCLPLTGFCGNSNPPVQNDNFITVIMDHSNCDCQPAFPKVNCRFIHATIHLKFNQAGNSRLSTGLSEILKEIVETIYPQLLLQHSKNYTFNLSSLHPNHFLHKIPFYLDLDVSIA